MAISFGMLSTYPPTQCGLATFSQALVTHLDGSGADVGIVRIVDSPQPAEPRVTHQLVIGERGAARRAAHALNLHDVAIIQHEYGIFGGRDGADVLDVLAEVCVPVISVLHTVLTTPSPNQRRVLAGVVAASSVVVTMTQTARQRLLDGWDVDPGKVMVIAHGAEDNRAPELGHDDMTRWEDEGGSRDDSPRADIARCRHRPCRPRREATHHPDLGPARAGEGHRVGDPGDGGPRGPRPQTSLRGRRRDPPPRGRVGR